jgi:predicted DNA-binding helix-hairpin-helix protein
VQRILQSRRSGALRLDDLTRLRLPLRKVLPFVLLPDHGPGTALDQPQRLRAALARPPRQAALF